MASTVKPLKEKPTGPRLLPRPTAASAARAARNAANRTPPTAGPQRSPVRCPPSPASSKVKTTVPRNSNKSDSRTEVKINRNRENDVYCSQIQGAHNNETSFDVENDLTVENPVQDLNNGEVNVIEISETHTFEVISSGINKSEFESTTDIIDNKEINNPPLPTDRAQTPKSVPSRPQTPKNVSSRPQTPINAPSRPETPHNKSSRPQTPKIQSRPTTPAHPLQRNPQQLRPTHTPQRHSTPVRQSAPSTPNSLSQRPKTPVLHPYPPSMKTDEDLTSAYSKKHKELHRLKKELDLKQQDVLQVFDTLNNIRDCMLKDGISVKGDMPQELNIFNVADWATEEIAQLCRDAADSSAGDRATEAFDARIVIDVANLAAVEDNALKVPEYFAELCLQAFTARQELIDWVNDLVNKNEITSNDVMDRIAQYNTQGLQMCEALRDTKTQADKAMDSITLLSKQVLQERSALMRVEESLVREIERLKQDLETRGKAVQQVTDTQTMKALEEARRELEEERTAKANLKDKLATTESQLKNARLRVSKMDKQLREAEASIASLTGTVKTLEDQSRQRETNLEARARKLKESLKTGEVTSNQLSQQRNALQAELNELKEQMKTVDSQYKIQIEELNKKLKETLASREEERKKLQRETELKESLEESLIASQNNVKELETKIVELENNRPNPDLPTEREMDIWAELHATKDTLRIAEDEAIACKREKIRFLESLAKISESEDKTCLQKKLASELLSKEEIISKMQMQIRELTKTTKLNEQKVLQYEQYVHDLQAHSRSIANSEESWNGITYQNLQEEVMSLKMNLLDAVHRNEELLEKLTDKEQQLEQQDKTSRAQARVLKVREELISMLENKETEQSRELSALQQDLEHRMKVVDDVNKQIAAKANEIQDLFSTLEKKQLQIHRLEKIVLALEEQQRRSQAQRTRHEEKIAMLEHELAAGNRRERKYLFF